MKMESEGEENAIENSEEYTIVLSNRSLKRLEKANNEEKDAVSLILDRNDLQRLDNIESYSSLSKLSLAHNKLLRMEGVSSLVHLTFLDISYNSLVCIKGLKDLRDLKHLNLAGNKIKVMDHLNQSVNLEYLDLSQNLIVHISDISLLHNLKKLLLHNNEIAHLHQCEKNLPSSLQTLTLNNNSITDLNEVSHLVLLESLKELSLCGNPCLEFTDSRIDFNYRPFVKNWCSTIVTLDGYPLDDIECLKAEWLYSQGRGRSFRPGEHLALAMYLTSVCPQATQTNLESEDEKKLRLILSKAHHHQQQLKEQLSGGSPLPSRHKSTLNRKKSLLAERMVLSYHDTPTQEITRGLPDLMSRSVDGVLMRNSPVPSQSNVSEAYHNPLETATTLLPVPESLTSPDVCRSLHQFPVPSPKLSFPLTASYSGRNPVPSSKVPPFTPVDSKAKKTNVLRRHNNNSSSPLPQRKSDKIMSPAKSKSATGKIDSPKKKTMPITTVALSKPSSNGKDSSEDDDSEYSELKIKRISSQKKYKKHIMDFDGKENIEKVYRKNRKDSVDSDLWKAALCIQRYWRGYRTRHLNNEVMEAYKNIQTIRIQDYIIKVANDMEATKVALEGHRKLQVLQMQAINALWKKMVNLQPGGGLVSTSENKNTLQGLAETCTNLNKQVEELQNMMKIMNNNNHCQVIPIATQTEIVAVHTPVGDEKEGFPYYTKLERPNLLQVTQNAEPAECGTSTTRGGNETVSSGTESISETKEERTKRCVTSEEIELEKEDSVCLTPACQEGKDLQSIMAANTELSAESSSKSTSGIDGPGTDQKSEEKPTEESGYQHYGCPFS